MRPPRPAPSWAPRPKIRTWPPLPRIPHPNAARVFPKPSTQGYTYISGPTPASWGTDRTRTRSTRGPAADQVTQQPAAPAQAPPAPSRVIGQGRPLTLFFPVPPKALPAAVPPKHSAAAAPPAPAAGYPQPVPKPGSSRRTHALRRRVTREAGTSELPPCAFPFFSSQVHFMRDACRLIHFPCFAPLMLNAVRPGYAIPAVPASDSSVASTRLPS